MKRIVIARHGNTFGKGETPTRVGCRTDLPLVEEDRSRAVGKYLVQRGMIPDVVYAAPLKRTLQTADFILKQAGCDIPVEVMEAFVEIDYGLDENKPETEVLLRLGNGDLEAGKKVIDAWNKDATVPQGWIVDPAQIIRTWKQIGETVAAHPQEDYTVLIVSSNGIIRFAPYLTEDFASFAEHHDIKVATGGLCVFEKHESEQHWRCIEWNTVPIKLEL